MRLVGFPLSRPDFVRELIRQRLPWAWATRWWPLGPAALFLTAAVDPHVVGGQTLTWSVVWFSAGLAALTLIGFPLSSWARYAACFTGVLGFAGRGLTLILANPAPAPVAWTAVAAWACSAVTYTTLLALSWWVTLNYPKPPGSGDG